MNDPQPLSEAENERIFQRRILPSLPPVHERNAHPALVFVAGQSAAGKSGAIASVYDSLSREGPAILLQRDDLRAFYPGYERQLQEHGPEGYKFSEEDSWKWYHKVKAHALEHGTHLVVESTFRKTGEVVADMEAFRAGGYRIEARVLGVHPEKSLAGVYGRYENQLANGQPARFVDPRTHDAALAGLGETLRRIESERLADRVTVQRRSGEVMAEDRLENGEWTRPPSAALTVEREHTRPLAPEELREVAGDWARIRGQAEARKAPEAEMQTIRSEQARVAGRFIADAARRREQGERTGDLVRECAEVLGLDSAGNREKRMTIRAELEKAIQSGRPGEDMENLARRALEPEAPRQERVQSRGMRR